MIKQETFVFEWESDKEPLQAYNEAREFFSTMKQLSKKYSFSHLLQFDDWEIPSTNEKETVEVIEDVNILDAFKFCEEAYLSNYEKQEKENMKATKERIMAKSKTKRKYARETRATVQECLDEIDKITKEAIICRKKYPSQIKQAAEILKNKKRAFCFKQKQKEKKYKYLFCGLGNV